MHFNRHNEVFSLSAIFFLIALIITGACGWFFSKAGAPVIPHDLVRRWQNERNCSPVSFGSKGFFLTLDWEIFEDDRLSSSVKVFSDNNCQNAEASSVSNWQIKKRITTGDNSSTKFDVDLSLKSLTININKGSGELALIMNNQAVCGKNNWEIETHFDLPQKFASCAALSQVFQENSELYQEFLLTNYYLEILDFTQKENAAWWLMLPALSTKAGLVGAEKRRLVAR
jgi:hypothetical protein